MSNIILGTAGHIDHGKTTLIKALTGINTDRLKEEQERGITIELGFAYLNLPSGRRISIVDVPGHEKFVKNMLAGAGGVDVVMLVIAADEGIMPQTREHLNIMELMEIKRGLVALTKMDLVDEDWLEMMQEEVQNQLKGTFLENSPIIPVSSITGKGIPQLLEAIEAVCKQDIDRDLDSPFRLPVDRVFSLQGIGTVVTGSLISGIIKSGDEIEIFPRRIKSRIRSIQVHGQSRDKVEAGERTALNLADIKVSDIKRGDVIAPIGALLTVTKAYAYIKVLKDAAAPLKNNDRIRVHIGTAETFARVRLLDKDEITKDKSGFGLFLFEEPVSCAYKDRYVMRSYSPVTTLGGGHILFVNPPRVKKNQREQIVISMKKALEGDLPEFILGFLEYFGPKYLPLNDIVPFTGKNETIIKYLAQKLADENKIVSLKTRGEYIIFNKNYYENLSNQVKTLVENYHKKFPLSNGMAKEEVRSRINLEPGIFESLLGKWVENGIYDVQENIIKKKEFNIVFNKKQQQISNKVLEIYMTGGWTPPSLKEVQQSFPDSKPQEVNEVILRLVDEGKLVKMDEELFMSQKWVEKARRMLQSYFEEQNQITVSQFREMLGTSRKYAIPLAEYLDGLKVTKRVKDVRVAGPHLYRN